MNNKEIEKVIDKINLFREKLNMPLLKIGEEEYKMLLNLYEKIDNSELLFEILTKYYSNNSLGEYIKVIIKILDTINVRPISVKNIKKDKEKNIDKAEDNKYPRIVENDRVKLKVESKNLLNIINSYFDDSFINNRNYYYLKDNSIGVLTMQSRVYNHPSYKYWYTYHKYQKKMLDKYNEKYMLLYFKDSGDGLIIPTLFIEQYKVKLGKTINKEKDDIGIHIHIEKKNGEYFLRIPYEPLVSLKDFKLKQEKVEVIKISSNYKQINIKRGK